MGLLTIICENQNLPWLVHLKKKLSLKKVTKMKIAFRQLYLPLVLRKEGDARLNTFLANTSVQKFSCRSLCGRSGCREGWGALILKWTSPSTTQAFSPERCVHSLVCFCVKCTSHCHAQPRPPFLLPMPVTNHTDPVSVLTPWSSNTHLKNLTTLMMLEVGFLGW